MAENCGAVWPTDRPEHACGKIDIHPGAHGCECGSTIERGKAYPSGRARVAVRAAPRHPAVENPQVEGGAMVDWINPREPWHVVAYGGEWGIRTESGRTVADSMPYGEDADEIVAAHNASIQ